MSNRLTAKILEAMADRIDDQVTAEEVARNSRPAVAGPGGTYQRLGGMPIQPLRPAWGSGAVPIGSPVQVNQGIIQGAARGPQTFEMGAEYDGLSQLDILIEKPAAQEYILVYNSRYRCELTGVYHPTPAGLIVTTEPTKRGVIEKGGQLTLILSGTIPTTPLNVSIEMRRLT